MWLKSGPKPARAESRSGEDALLALACESPGTLEQAQESSSTEIRATSRREGILFLQHDFSETSSSPKNGPARRIKGGPAKTTAGQEIVSAAGFEPATHALKEYSAGRS